VHPSPALSKNPQILLADDEPAIRGAIQRALTSAGYIVRPACDGFEARGFLERMSEFPELFITDMDMPGYGGEELAQYARTRCTGLKVLFTSGEPQSHLLDAIEGDSNSRFLLKPFGSRKLLETIQEMGVAAKLAVSAI
jgi:two-component system, cell cycle sensor histidine kinase and response regulator CckA